MKVVRVIRVTTTNVVYDVCMIEVRDGTNLDDTDGLYHNLVREFAYRPPIQVGPKIEQETVAFPYDGNLMDASQHDAIRVHTDEMLLQKRKHSLDT